MSGRAKVTGISILAFLLGACGGGGGGSVNSAPSAPISPTTLPNPMPNPVTNPSSENFDTAEYRNSSAAVGSNAMGAWQAGASGRGITLGFVDTGIVPTLSDFAGRIHPNSTDVNGSRPMGDVYGHGTAVAGIAAAARDGRGMQGIAYEATIFMAKADEGCPKNCVFPTDAIADGIDAARAAGATAINLSIGGKADSDIRAAVQRAVNAGVIVVVGAGNSGSNPSDLARELASIAPDQVIIVGGLGVSNPDGTINYSVPSIYTSAAGASQNSFLAAPGWLNSASYFKLEGSFDKLSGTSFAAPVVTGAIALIAEAFPMLTPKQIVLLLYMSADDLGAAGTDATFGRGRLNISRAFQPIGTLHMANTMAAPPKSLGVMPSAAGDAGRRANLNAIMLDFFDRPFDVNLASSLGERREAGLLQRSLTIGQRTAYSAVGPISFTYAVDGQDVQSQRLARLGLSPSQERAARLIAGIAVARLTGESSVAVGFGTGSSTIRDQFADRLVNGSPLADSASSMMGFYPASVNSIGYSHQIANWRLFLAVEKGSISPSRGELDAPYSMMQWSAERSRSNGRIRLGTSWLVERRTMLGGTFNPMFGDGNSRTWFADLEAERKLGLGWSLRGDFRLGKTSFLSGQVTTSAFSLDLAKTGVLSAQDALMFRLWQPLRVESGSVGLTLPISWDYKTRTATDGRRSLSLIPSGRELSLEVGYDRTLPAGLISLHLFTRRNAEHSRTSDVDAGLAVRSRLKL